MDDRCGSGSELNGLLALVWLARYPPRLAPAGSIATPLSGPPLSAPATPLLPPPGPRSTRVDERCGWSSSLPQMLLTRGAGAVPAAGLAAAPAVGASCANGALTWAMVCCGVAAEAGAGAASLKTDEMELV